MGWEQLAPSIQSAFDTYWGRKEGQKGRAHEKEMQGQRIAHDKLQRTLDRAQEKFVADRTADLQQQGLDQAAADAQANRELQEELKRVDINQRNVEIGEAARAAREGQVYETGERRETQDWTAGQTGIEQTRLNQQAALERQNRLDVAGIQTADQGKEFSPGDLAEAITGKADEAAALFKAGWEDFSRVFPRLLSKEQYDMLKQMDKDTETANYLMAEIAKEYIRMYATEAEEAGYNLPKELNYLLKIDDKYMESIKATYDEEMSKAKQKKAAKKEKTATQAKEWGQWRTGPSPLDAPFRSKFPRATAGYDKFLEFFKKLP